MANVTKVWIEEDECIACEACIGEAPEILEMDDDKCVVKTSDPAVLAENSEQIVAAAEACPTDAVKYESA